MNQTWLTLFIGTHVALSLAILTISHGWVDAQIQNSNSSDTNETRMILNVKDNTVTLVNTTSNETISIRNLTGDTKYMISNETKSSISVMENAENTSNLNNQKFKN
jgi:hypothetical protein